MSALVKVFDLILQQFSMVWNAIKSSVSLFTGIFDTFASLFDNLFQHLGIYDSIISALDTLSGLAANLNGLINQGTLSSTILSFCAFDTFFTVLVTVVTGTVGVLVALIAFVFLLVVPALLGFLTVKAVLRLIRLCTAGIAKP